MVRTSLKTGEHTHLQLNEADYNSDFGVWICKFDKAFSIHLSVAKQIDLMFQYAYLADCNEAMARMYGFKSSADMIGTRLMEFLPANNENIEYLSTIIMNQYRIENAESKEIDSSGRTKYFLNTLKCFIENEMVTGAIGYQEEINHTPL